MNKHDIKLIFILIIFIFITFIYILNSKSYNVNNAYVYYNDKLIKTIDLSVNKSYNVKGYNGNIKIVVRDKKIKVDQEKSPLHLCSKQGYISKSYESIICLPNKTVIKLDKSSDNSDIDALAR